MVKLKLISWVSALALIASAVSFSATVSADSGHPYGCHYEYETRTHEPTGQTYRVRVLVCDEELPESRPLPYRSYFFR